MKYLFNLHIKQPALQGTPGMFRLFTVFNVFPQLQCCQLLFFYCVDERRGFFGGGCAATFGSLNSLDLIAVLPSSALLALLLSLLIFGAVFAMQLDRSGAN